MCFDPTDAKTFQNVRFWLEEVERYADPTIEKLLVSTKDDLVEQRVVTREAAAKFAVDNGMQLIETSAKNSTNVDEGVCMCCFLIPHLV